MPKTDPTIKRCRDCAHFVRDRAKYGFYDDCFTTVCRLRKKENKGYHYLAAISAQVRYYHVQPNRRACENFKPKGLIPKTEQENETNPILQ